jgi:hypothetical protein
VAIAQKPRQIPVGGERAALRADAVTAGVALLAFYSLALALFMVVLPHTFYTSIGPFGQRNDHYIRDNATFSAAIGFGLLLALRLRSWRVPMLAVTTIQFALHSINHLVDIDTAHPAWTGYFDFFSLALSTVMLAGLVRLAMIDGGSRDGVPGRRR